MDVVAENAFQKTGEQTTKSSDYWEVLNWMQYFLPARLVNDIGVIADKCSSDER